MTVSVVVPLRPDQERLRNWEAVCRQYPDDWEVIVAYDHDHGPWRKGPPLAEGVRLAAGDVLVLADADLFLGTLAFRLAVELLEAGAPWVAPIGQVYRLSAEMTHRLHRALPTGPHRVGGRHHPGVVGGGIVICSRTAFETVGGIDPRFTGWGGEDISFGRALDTLIGPHAAMNAVCWHLWHEPMRRHPGRRASPENETLAGRYLDATGDPTMMKALIAEHREDTQWAPPQHSFPGG